MPNKPENVTQSIVTSNQIVVQWMPPSGKVDDYRLTLTKGGAIEKILSVQGTSHSFIELLPGTMYSVEVESQSGGLYSEPVGISVTTSKHLDVTFSTFVHIV